MTDPTPYTDEELAEIVDLGFRDKGAWPIPELLATVDAERARREQAERIIRTVAALVPDLMRLDLWPDAEADAIRRVLDASPTEGNPDDE